jgi:hypothetical protein
MQSLSERALAAAGVQLRDEQAGGGVPEFHRCDQAQQIIPVFGNQPGLDRLAEHRPSVRVSRPAW